MMTKVARKQLERVVPFMLLHSMDNGLFTESVSPAIVESFRL